MEYQEVKIKTRVVGVDISSNRTTLAIVNIRGKIIAESRGKNTNKKETELKSIISLAFLIFQSVPAFWCGFGFNRSR